MRKNLCNNVLRTSAFALACLALAGADAKASSLQTYSTSATFAGDGITGTSVIGFNPVSSGSFQDTSSVGLGSFVVSTLPDGVSTTYNNSHFTISYNPVSVNGLDYPSNSAVTITGELNGTITGNTSTVTATFDPIQNPVFTANGNFLSTLSVLDNPLALVPASATGMTSIQAQVTTSGPVPAPEPTTMAILATSLVGFGLRQKLRSGRKSA